MACTYYAHWSNIIYFSRLRASPLAFTDKDGHLFMLRTGFTPYAAALSDRVYEWCLKFRGVWKLSQEKIDDNNRGPHDFTVEGIDRNNKKVSYCLFQRRVSLTQTVVAGLH
jgi:hypothetical protein